MTFIDRDKRRQRERRAPPWQLRAIWSLAIPAALFLVIFIPAQVAGNSGYRHLPLLLDSVLLVDGFIFVLVLGPFITGTAAVLWLLLALSKSASAKCKIEGLIAVAVPLAAFLWVWHLWSRGW